MRHTRVGIADLVKQVQQELALSLKNRKVVWTLEPLPEVTGDPTLLKQVLVSMQQASRRTFARYSYQARRRWCNGQARSLGDCPSPTCDKMRRFVSAENPCRPGRPRDGDFSAAARNSSQVLAHSRVTLLFFRPRLGEMLQDAGQPQHGGRAGRVLRPGPRRVIGTTRFCAAQHVFRGEGGPRRQAGPAARGQISPQATDIAINSSKETD